MHTKMDKSSKNICRICMESGENVVFLFDTIENNRKTLAEMLTECSKYKVHKEDKLPKYICEKCSSDVQNAYSFKQRVEKSYDQLIELIYKESEGSTFQNTQQHTNFNHLEKSTQTENIAGTNEQHSCREADPNKTTCPICYRFFARKDHTKEHIIKVHKDDANKYFKARRGLKLEKFECPICERKFNRKQHITRHIILVHKEDPNSVLMQLYEKVEKTDEKQIPMNDNTQHNKGRCLEKNPISSDPEIERDLVDLPSRSNTGASVKGKPNEIENLQEGAPEEMIVKVEPPHFYDFESENCGYNDTNLKESSGNLQAKKNIGSNTSDDDSEPLIKIKNLMAQKRYGNGEGTVEQRTCTLCKRVFSRFCHLRRHVQSAHTQEKPYRCSHCDKRFSRSDLLKNHIQGVHSEKTHKCDICEKAFSRKEALQRHKKTPHGVASNISFDCELCERTFTGKCYLAKHRLSHFHIFACRFCEDTFEDRKLLTEHERGHKSTTKDFLCSICGESFGRIDYLRIHVQRHLGEKPHKCQYCEKSFIRKSDLKEHERYHTNTRPNVCKICGRAFVRRSKLTIHMRIHTGEKPYKCEHCPKSFAQSNDLKAHIRRHTGERYKCQQCDATFLQLYGLRQHALSAHGLHIESSTGRLEKVGVPLL